MSVNIIIPAAGASSRAKTGQNKIFINAADGRSVIEYSVGVFFDFSQISKIVIAARRGDAERLAAIFKNKKNVVLVDGGETRSKSVKNALAALSDDCDIVLIHDAARPYVSKRLINGVIAAAKKYGSAVPCLGVSDSLKLLGRDGAISVDRTKFLTVSTPQGFKAADIAKAYASLGDGVQNHTDDSSVYESAIGAVHTISGEEGNIKITTERDVQSFMKYSPLTDSAFDIRIGNGYDFHKFAAGRRLILGGIEIPHDLGLAGHSDADALTHAVIDAMLSSVSERNIGELFPDDDPLYEEACSLGLLSAVCQIMRKKSAALINLSCVIICDRPKLSPYLDKIKASLSSTLNISADRISISCKTTEGERPLGLEVDAVCLTRIKL
ncbi:MAG: 2-C-methyl-D-erythritol 2,4-cyclodiphosphate synthase [Clostridiales bacterium]|jgi:2-C-methyl-D-erythritol 4-phosphate cytidylyltransferase/2-C-methyl-D-erythritol 2,4-cyclodiphosphate synthase|nr:2-C-methyl-D-erythritol 2,4-cyclodiphosphate synthase [Clostridiales bacterium]